MISQQGSNMTKASNPRRTFLGSAGGFVLTLMAPSYGSPNRAMNADELLVYVGTYTTGKSEGIYLYRLSLATGDLRTAGTVKGVVNPSYLAIDPRRRFLYAVNEVSDFQGKAAGAVSAFSIDRRTGDLTFLNQQSSMGGSPCYL